MIEVTFRVYLFGADSLNPVHMNSYNQIHHSGIVQPASDPQVSYELKPDYSGWYKGARFTTNSYGLRDREYPLLKPANTLRVAVLGSSWTMGSGVEVEEIWHSVLEKELNEAGAGEQNYEFINFGVDQYGLGELVAVLETKVPAFSPDLVIIAFTHYTPTILWVDPPIPYKAQGKRNPFFYLWSLRVIDVRLNLGLYSDDDARRTTADANLQGNQQLKKALQKFAAYSQSTGTPVVIVKLAYAARWKQNIQSGESILAGMEADLISIDVVESMSAHGYQPEQLRVSVWDSHPNALGHRLIAQAVKEGLTQHNLLPAGEAAARPQDQRSMTKEQ
jgi:lysophospholipase L1-like esterase